MTLEEYNKQRKSFEAEFDEALSKYRLVEPKPLDMRSIAKAGIFFLIVAAIATMFFLGYIYNVRLAQ